MKFLNSEFYECYLRQMARKAIEKMLPRRSSGLPDSWKWIPTSNEVQNKTDGRASSPEPDAVDAPFPTTDADAYPLSNRPEAVVDISYYFDCYNN